MQLKALSVLAGVGLPLIAAGAANAGFVGIKVVVKAIPPTAVPPYQPGFPGPTGGFVCNIYANFNRPPIGGVVQDRFLAAAGTPLSPMSIQVLGAGATFYQNPFNAGDGAPSAALVGAFPSIAFDSFVTIGAKKIGNPGGQFPPPLTLTPGWPGFGPSSLGGTNLSWANTPVDPNTDPFNPAFVDGNGKVLIAQFTTLNGTGIIGMFRILVTSNTVGQQINVSFSHIVPAPGALALMGTAGLVGKRRRRRC